MHDLLFDMRCTGRTCFRPPLGTLKDPFLAIWCHFLFSGSPQSSRKKNNRVCSLVLAYNHACVRSTTRPFHAPTVSSNAKCAHVANTPNADSTIHRVIRPPNIHHLPISYATGSNAPTPYNNQVVALAWLGTSHPILYTRETLATTFPRRFLLFVLFVFTLGVNCVG